MIQPQDLFSINFYEKSPFHGSFRGMRYRIEKTTDEKGKGKNLKATFWPGPYNYETTDDTLKESALFPFSNEGLAKICAWLNQIYEKGTWRK